MLFGGPNNSFTEQNTYSSSHRAASMNLEALAMEESKLQSGPNLEELEAKLQLYTD